MIMTWNVTKDCNLSCKHCYRNTGGGKPSEEIKTEETRSLMEEMVQAGFKTLIFGGGEPLLRSDIFDLISFAAEYGLKTVLGTNGVLMGQETVRKLKDSGLNRAEISLDSVDSDLHDEFRGHKGAWEKTIGAMKICRQEGLEFQVHSTVAQHNCEGLENLMDFAADQGAVAHQIFFLLPVSQGRNAHHHALPQEDYDKLLVRIFLRQNNSSMEIQTVCAPQFAPLAGKIRPTLKLQRGCSAGITSCCILSNGDVHPCPYLSLRLGNVRKMSFSKIWRENLILQKLRAQEYKGQCGICANKYSCGGCRARAFSYHGDFLGEDPGCVLPRQENFQSLLDEAKK